MICPGCESENHKVMATRQSSLRVTRARKCGDCGHTWQTAEIDIAHLNVMESAVKALNTLSELHKELQNGSPAHR